MLGRCAPGPTGDHTGAVRPRPRRWSYRGAALPAPPRRVGLRFVLAPCMPRGLVISGRCAPGPPRRKTLPVFLQPFRLKEGRASFNAVRSCLRANQQIVSRHEASLVGWSDMLVCHEACATKGEHIEAFFTGSGAAPQRGVQGLAAAPAAGHGGAAPPAHPDGEKARTMRALRERRPCQFQRRTLMPQGKPTDRFAPRGKPCGMERHAGLPRGMCHRHS